MYVNLSLIRSAGLTLWYLELCGVHIRLSEVHTLEIASAPAARHGFPSKGFAPYPQEPALKLLHLSATGYSNDVVEGIFCSAEEEAFGWE